MMGRAIQSLSLLVLIVFTCNGLLGCSGLSNNPAIPPESPAEQVVEPATDPGRSLWGIWAVEFDTDQLTATIKPIRNPQAHYNITNMVTPPACDDCVTFEVLWFEPVSRVLGIEVTMRNPTNISAYDVRGILYTNDYGHLLTDADDWTGLWDMPGGQTLNPFKAFAKGEPSRLFAGLAEHSEYYKIYIPQPPNYNAITFAVDVSWPGNCKEPYEIENFSQEPILNITGSSGNIYVDVHDWQGDVNNVILEAPEITGEDSTPFTHLTGDTWNLLLQNNEGASAGKYQVRINATSTNSLDLPLYDYIEISITAEIPTDGWARTWGGIDSDGGNGVAIDGDGNAYITGYFADIVDFDPGPGIDEHATNGGADIFLSKFDAAGDFQWTRTWGGSSSESGRGVAIDGNGNAYITGYFADIVDFDPGPGVDEHTSNGGADIFLSKFDSAGVLQWARTWGGWGGDLGYGLAIDGSDNAYITGCFGDIVDFDPGPGVDEHTENGNGDIFLSKFDSAGDFQWARTWGGSYSEAGFGVAIDGSGNAYITGRFGGTVDFDPGPGVDEHTCNDWWDRDIFLSKFDSAGVFQWARTWGGDEQDFGIGLTADVSGNTYITGFFEDTVDFDPGPGFDWHTSNITDIFLSKFDSAGDFQWARTWGGSSGDRGYGVAIDGSGNAYITGYFYGTVDFDPGPGIDEHTSNGWFDIFLSKFNSSGDFQWARTLGGSDWESVYGIAIDGSSNAYITGEFTGTVDFNPGSVIDEHTSNGSYDIFLIKIPPDGNW